MPCVRIQDSDGKEQFIIGDAVIGIGITKDVYLAKIVSREVKDLPRVIRATIKYFSDKYPNELKEAIEKLNEGSKNAK